VSVVASGDFTASYSTIDIDVQTVPGVFNDNIASTPTDPF
jgi:hypothetical protein